MQPSWRYRPTRVTRKVNIGNFICQMSGDIAPNKGVCGVPVVRPMKGFLNESNRSFVVHISRFCQVENQLSCSQICWCIKNGNIIPLLSNTNVATNAGRTFIYFYENKGSVLTLWKYQSAGKWKMYRKMYTACFRNWAGASVTLSCPWNLLCTVMYLFSHSENRQPIEERFNTSSIGIGRCAKEKPESEETIKLSWVFGLWSTRISYLY